MCTLLVFSVFGAASYLLGAIPFGYVIAKSKGIDLFKTGSGSIGATNVFRSLGKKWGILTFFLDALKGFIPSFFFPLLASRYDAECNQFLLALLCAALSVTGHNWPVYLRFKGGKGIATSAGALAGIVPGLIGSGLITWTVVFLLTRYVSVASITVAVIIMIGGWVFYSDRGPALPVVLTILGIFAIWRHKSNIQRLINGTENRFEFNKSKNKMDNPENDKNVQN